MTTASKPHQSADFATPKPRAGAAAPVGEAINKEDFARRHGFASFLEMFEASQSVGNAGGKKKWLLTSLRGGKWLLWNEGELESAREYDSREDALPSVPRKSSGGNSEAVKMQG